jgi:hypothetical protein
MHMADASNKFQLFAITFLLATPTDLHNIWIAQGRSFDEIKKELVNLGFSPKAIDDAKTFMFDPMKQPLKDSFAALKKTIADRGTGLPFYDTGSHPAPLEAKTIVAHLRAADEGSAAKATIA